MITNCITGGLYLEILVFIFNSILLGAGLAMDAFSVSLANGLNETKMRLKKTLLIAGTFAVFQAAMPLIGWVCVHTMSEKFESFQKYIPWIALVLLLFIGGKLVYSGIRGGGDAEAVRLTPAALLIQGVATSIDALSVGFTIANYGPVRAVTAALIIGAVTFVICLAGLKLGRRFGTKLAGKASILGGLILIGIGIEIFVTGI
ncbi:MAG: manganese efflux pump [Ruminococcus sp.]|nr:manganese efflux pump [Ruminococcus sp.]